MPGLQYKNNKYDYFVILLVSLISLGNLGGSLQPSRLVPIVLIPFTLSTLNSFAPLGKIKKWIQIFILFCIVSLLWTPDVLEGTKEVLYYVAHFTLFIEIVVFTFYSNNKFESLTWGWTFNALIYSLIAIWELRTGSHLSIASDMGSYFNFDGYIAQRQVVFATFGNYNAFVTHICMTFPCLFYRLSKVDKINVQAAFIMVTLIVSAISILLDASRGGLLTMIVMSVIYFIFSKKSFVKGFFTFALVGIMGYILVMYGEDILQVILYRSAGGALFKDESRGSVWSHVWQVSLSTYLIGTGIGGMQAALYEMFPDSINVAHNAFLELFCQFGFVFLYVFLKFIYDLFRKSMKVTNQDVKTTLLMFLIAMPIYSVINSTYLLSPNYFVLFASIYILANYELFKSTN